MFNKFGKEEKAKFEAKAETDRWGQVRVPSPETVRALKELASINSLEEFAEVCRRQNNIPSYPDPMYIILGLEARR